MTDSQDLSKTNQNSLPPLPGAGSEVGEEGRGGEGPGGAGPIRFRPPCGSEIVDQSHHLYTPPPVCYLDPAMRTTPLAVENPSPPLDRGRPVGPLELIGNTPLIDL